MWEVELEEGILAETRHFEHHQMLVLSFSGHDCEPALAAKNNPGYASRVPDGRPLTLSRASIPLWLRYTAARRVCPIVPRLHAQTLSLLHDAPKM
jgi:hypothetical protein